MLPPVDATTTPAWARLRELREGFTPDLRGWFAVDPGRAAAFTRTCGDPVSYTHLDVSKRQPTSWTSLLTTTSWLTVPTPRRWAIARCL